MTVPGTQVRQERRKDDRDQGKNHKEKLSTRCPSHGKHRRFRKETESLGVLFGRLPNFCRRQRPGRDSESHGCLTEVDW